MLFGVVSRLTAQKGTDLIVQAAPDIIAQSGQLVMLGKGDADLENALRSMAQQHPGRVHVTIGFDESLAHLIEAGADCFLMPSRFEPCGLNQLYSRAYGTPPIVHATGGLADSVVDKVTGFVFAPATAEALIAAVERAFSRYRDPAVWDCLVQGGLSQSLDWSGSAARYESVYQNLRLRVI